MAYAIIYTASFKDRLSAITFKVDILQEGYGGGSSTITNMGAIPVSLKYKSEKGKDQYIIGSSLKFNFKSLPADNNKYDALFEGEEKEFKVNYYKDATLIWTGYLQPDNLRRSLLDELYEIQLNASDWLANLKDVEFKNGSTSYIDHATIFETIKTCLGFTGIELDFTLQMNTYETTYMGTASKVFSLTYIDLARFTKTENGKTKYTSVYDVLTNILKPFNCSLSQTNGLYVLINTAERESNYRPYDWAALFGGVAFMSERNVDITNFTLEKNSNKTKLKPELRLDFKRNSNDIGGELVINTNDFSGSGPWTIVTDDGYTNSNDQINITDTNPTTNDNYIKCTTASLSPVASKYIKVAFDVTFNVGEQWEPIFYYVKITKPSSGEYIDGNITGTNLHHYESVIKDMFAIDESGEYDIEINVSDSAQPYASGVVTIENVRITSVNVGNPEFDQNYIAYIDENAQVKKDEIYFSDCNTNTDQGGFKVDSGGFVRTLAWNRDGETDGLAIHEIFALNLLKNRQQYKDLLTIGVYDNDFAISADSIIQIDSVYYKIIELETIYNKNIQKLMIEEFLSSDPSYTFTSAALSTINGKETDTSSPIGSGNLHGDLDGLSADDHLQYYNETRGDARYALNGDIVTDHGDLDGLGDDDHSQYHNNARGDARYYTQTQIDANFYTQSYLDSNFSTFAYLNTWYYKKLEGDARYRLQSTGIVHQSLTLLGADDHTQYHNNTRGDIRYPQLAAENVFTDQRNNFSGGAKTEVIIGAKNSETNVDSRVLFNEGESGTPNSLDYGFSIAYSGSAEWGLPANTFAIIRHNNSAVGIPVIQIDRGTGKISFRYHKAIDTNGISFEISSGATYWLMENDGDFHAEGDIIGFSTSVSDKRLKENIEPLSDSLDKILKIAGVSFDYINNKSGRHVGIIAQELKEIIPEVVIKKKLPLKTDSNKLWYVIRYTELIPYIIEGIKELSLKVSVLINNFSILVKKIDKTKAIADENDNEIKRLKHEINLLKKEVQK